jgi:chromosome segregation ATPase
MFTGFSLGAALWRTRFSATRSPAARPRKESIEDLEARLAALEIVQHRRAAAERNGSRDLSNSLAAIAALESSVADLTTRCDGRLAEVESRIGGHEAKLVAHDAKLKEIPTLAQVVSTMEEMLSSTISELDDKLSEQMGSIEILKTTVAQSDELMERVLDAIYSLDSNINDKSGGGGAGLAFGEGYAGVPSPVPPRLPHHPPMSIKLPLPD